MNTPTTLIYERFFRRVEEDMFFFRLFASNSEDGDEIAMQIARRRAHDLLVEAIAYLKRRCTVGVDLTIVEDDVQTDDTSVDEVSINNGDQIDNPVHVPLEPTYYINSELTLDEIDLLSIIMYLSYLERDIAKLKTRVNTFSSSDLRAIHSPANERRSFMEMVAFWKNKCDVAISDYAARDRLTGAFKSVNGVY